MLLYLRKQVEAFAFEKWGSNAGLDQEFERREKDKNDRKAKKFKAKLIGNFKLIFLNLLV